MLLGPRPAAAGAEEVAPTGNLPYGKQTRLTLLFLVYEVSLNKAGMLAELGANPQVLKRWSIAT